jgi:hypothetical protein
VEADLTVSTVTLALAVSVEADGQFQTFASAVSVIAKKVILAKKLHRNKLKLTQLKTNKK